LTAPELVDGRVLWERASRTPRGGVAPPRDVTDQRRREAERAGVGHREDLPESRRRDLVEGEVEDLARGPDSCFGCVAHLTDAQGAPDPMPRSSVVSRLTSSSVSTPHRGPAHRTHCFVYTTSAVADEFCV
jgi:hypothetical protein